ncbi:MAG: 50S ribosomal protein L23 [bacterium]|nr:50S ribosomal protein L23 [bacterium]
MIDLSIIQRSLITEKATDLQAYGKYVFVVPSSANKTEIKKAVAKKYKVDVLRVEVINMPPKAKKFRGVRRETKAFKKAVVTVKEGQKINLE